MEHWMLPVIQALGPTAGVLFVIWLIDGRRVEKQQETMRQQAEDHKAQVAATLTQYRDDVASIRTLYESNVRLVEETQAMAKRLEALYSETMSVISLNTQTQARLIETIRTNQFCPLVREKGGTR